ncbi:MAG: hypothetical protein NTW17_00320 [Candidatus Pacearchaeota archaeon]|nr:hypothetical protein [Candidatus Pacearchaeota archaeon]
MTKPIIDTRLYKEESGQNLAELVHISKDNLEGEAVCMGSLDGNDGRKRVAYYGWNTGIEFREDLVAIHGEIKKIYRCRRNLERILPIRLIPE